MMMAIQRTGAEGKTGIQFQPYVVMLYLGIVAGVIGGSVWAGSHGLNPARVNAALLALVLPALLGARLLYVGLHWPVYRRDPKRILRRSDGGAALYGGLATAFVISLPLLSALGLPLGAFWDAATICLLVGMIFTKVGCLLNGCCAGRTRIPLQLLEAGLAALILLGSIAASSRSPFAGALFLGALGAYGVARFAIEPVRNTVDQVSELSVNRTVSAGVAAISAATLLVAWFA